MHTSINLIKKRVLVLCRALIHISLHVIVLATEFISNCQTITTRFVIILDIANFYCGKGSRSSAMEFNTAFGVRKVYSPGRQGIKAVI